MKVLKRRKWPVALNGGGRSGTSPLQRSLILELQGATGKAIAVEWGVRNAKDKGRKFPRRLAVKKRTG